jgi:lipopolysaccharide/colanic/teichoic acid biosynthesis glycosyltransferase
MALGLGYGWGIVQPARTIRDPEDTIGGVSYLAKRLIDVIGAFAGLIFTLIVWCFVALAIKLDSQGPVIFRQERVGQGGRPFTLYKFRTMNADPKNWPCLLNRAVSLNLFLNCLMTRD